MNLPDEPRPDLRSVVGKVIDGRALALCMMLGHTFEGRIIGRRLVGRCARCGIGAMTDGS